MSTVSRSVLVRLRAEMAQFKREWNEGTAAVKGTREELGRTERQSKQTGRAISDLDSVTARTGARLTKYRQEWDLVGSSLLRTGAVVSGASVLMAKAAIDWETAWTGVLKTVDGTPEPLAEVESGLRDLAKTMPASHQEIAATAEAAGQLGIAAEDIVGFTRVMVMMGDTTNLSADEAASSIAQLMNVMQTAPEDVDRLGASVVALGNDGASTERDIVQMAQRIAGAGEIVGLTEANVLSLANAVSSSGIEVEAGGSAISNVLIDISKAVDTGSPKLAQFADVAGTTADQFVAKWKSDPAAALADFTEGLGRMAADGEDVFSVLDDLGQSDIRVTRALLNMANAGDLLRDSIATGNQAWEENSALVEEAEKRYDTTAAKAEIAWNNIKDNAIDAGEGMLPIISALSDLVTDLGSVFGALPGPVKGSIGVLALFGGGTLLVVGGLMKAVGAARDFSDAMRVMEVSTHRGERAVGKLATVAGIATAALAAMQIASEFLDSGERPDVALYTSALLDLENGAVSARQELDELFTIKSPGNFVTGEMFEDITGLDDAIDKLDPGKLKGWYDGVRNFLSAGAVETEAEAAATAFEQVDLALTGMVQSGNLEQAASLYENLTMRMRDHGLSRDQVEEQFDSYLSALKDVENQERLNEDSAAGLSDAVSATDQVLADLGGNEDAVEQLRQMTDATKEAAASFLDLAENIAPADASLEEWLSGLEEQAAAMDAWADNMIEAVARGVDEGVIEEFKRLGPEGAERLAELVDASDAEIARLNEVLGDGADGVGERLSSVLDGIRPEVVTEFKTPGAEDAIATAIEVTDKYNLAPDQVQTILEALNYASDDIDEVMEGLRWIGKNAVTAEVYAKTEAAQEALDAIARVMRNIPGFKQINIHTVGTTEGYIPGGGGRLTRAEGGPIPGQGGPKQDNILVAASVGEHMWTAREVENAGGHGAMYAMRAMARAGRRPRYADGGAVDDAWNQSFRTAAATFGAPVASVAAAPAAAAGSGGPTHLTGDLYLADGTFLGKVRGIATEAARAQVQSNNRHQGGERRRRQQRP